MAALRRAFKLDFPEAPNTSDSSDAWSVSEPNSSFEDEHDDRPSFKGGIEDILDSQGSSWGGFSSSVNSDHDSDGVSGGGCTSPHHSRHQGHVGNISSQHGSADDASETASCGNLDTGCRNGTNDAAKDDSDGVSGGGCSAPHQSRHQGDDDDLEDDSDSMDIDSANRLSYNLDNDDECMRAYDLFGYTLEPLIGRNELLRIAMYKIKCNGNVSLNVHQEYSELISCFTSERNPDRRTVENMLDRMTGMKHIRYDSCVGGCCAYTGAFEDLDYCPSCKKRRVRGPGKRDTYDYLELIHRLQLWYSEPQRAKELQSYNIGLVGGDMKRDIWDGNLISDLRQKGLLNSARDLAFVFSTDGVQLFRKGKQHTVWPLMLMCINLPPELRFLEENVICLGKHRFYSRDR